MNLTTIIYLDSPRSCTAFRFKVSSQIAKGVHASKNCATTIRTCNAIFDIAKLKFVWRRVCTNSGRAARIGRLGYGTVVCPDIRGVSGNGHERTSPIVNLILPCVGSHHRWVPERLCCHRKTMLSKTIISTIARCLLTKHCQHIQ